MGRAIISFIVGFILIISFFFYFAFQIDSEEALVKFIERYFILDNGAVLIENTDKGTVLSESVGLYLLGCAKLNDKISFDKTYDFVKRNFISSKGVLFWKINLETGKKNESSASIDDLRVVKALLLAWDIWKEKQYLQEALVLAKAIKERQVKDGYLVDSFSWHKHDATSSIVNISYLDLSTMQELSSYDSEWQLIYENCKELMIQAIKENGLFWEEYNLDKKKFIYKDGNMINQLLCALHLSESGVANIKLANFLREYFDRTGKIANKYSDSRVPLNTYENTSVYAFTSRFFYHLADAPYQRMFYKKLLSFQIKFKYNRYVGGFGRFSFFEPKIFNSFDNLEALLAIIDIKKENP